MASGEEARKAFAEYMSSTAANNGAGNQTRQQAQAQPQAQAQQPANLIPQMNPYAASLHAGAYGYPNLLAGFNPYAGQSGMGFNPVSISH